MKLFENYYWPGNIRELKNVIERILTLYGDSDTILEEHLPVEIRSGDNHHTSYNSNGLLELLDAGSLDEIVSRTERELIEKSPSKSKWCTNQSCTNPKNDKKDIEI